MTYLDNFDCVLGLGARQERVLSNIQGPLPAILIPSVWARWLNAGPSDAVLPEHVSTGWGPRALCGSIGEFAWQTIPGM